MKPAGLKATLILPVLLLSTFLAVSTLVFYSTLLVDIAQTFNVTPGTASQVSTVINFVGLFLGLAMGSLTLRFSHKTLFAAGIVLYGLGSLGLFFAPDFATALLVNLVIGVGIGMIEILTFSLIGDLLPLQKRGSAVGLVYSSIFLAFVFIGPLSGVIAQIAGWRSFLILFTLPASIVCLVLSLLLIPNRPTEQAVQAKSKYLDAVKQIFLNKSATVCLIGTTLMAVFSTLPIYAVSFYRVVFDVSASTGGIFAAIAAAGGIVGGAVGGRLVNRYGRKSLTVVGALISGVFAVTFTLLSVMWLSVLFWAINASFAAFAMAAMSNLILEQVPGFRASMMSTNWTFRAAGTILGLIIGGLVLNLFANNFQLLMGILGASGITVAVIILLFAKDPCKTPPTPNM